MTAVQTASAVDRRYRLSHVLGTGGAGVVRLAHDERLCRDVAIKLFHPGAADQARNQSEIALMARLTHRALVTMYDGGCSVDINGTDFTYLVMEYVPGQTLRRALDDGPLPRDHVAAIARDLASALDYLEAEGVVHRDVKPANILLTTGATQAKLGDFGVAQMVDGSHVTATGTTVGTPNYLSPEQVRGDTARPASDVYSLGLVVLEALTGRMAYAGSGVAAALARLDHAPAIPRSLGANWCALLVAMLDPSPDSRPTASQVCRDLALVETDAIADARTRTTAEDDSNLDRRSSCGDPILSASEARGTALRAGSGGMRRSRHRFGCSLGVE